MHPIAAALGISALLVVAGTALSLVGGEAFAEDVANPSVHAHASRPGGHPAAGAHAWEGGSGTIPTLQKALFEMERRARIVIVGDDAFNPANGVRGGSGSFDDPFVISGWYVDQVLIADTSKAFVFKENYVSDILILDWTGQGGYVHHNHLNDLRTNRNVARTGDPSASVIEHNEILRVEELRHFDGELRKNVIGREDSLPLVERGVVLNIAGLNGAGIHDNRIFGGVDMKIHGHHHSDAAGSHSHNHAAADATQMEDHLEDHQVRYVDFRFYNNTIKDDGFGLRYNDLDHAGDDRQAASEQEPALELPHVHHTTITLEDNLLDGASLRVATVNAKDERHLPGETATLVLRNNRILHARAGDGIHVQDVANARVLVEGNKVERAQTLAGKGASAVLLERFANSTIDVRENQFADYRYGVRAKHFDASTNWTVSENRAPGAQYDVYWDESVANPPRDASAGDHAHEGHEHGGARQDGGAPRGAASAGGATVEAARFDARNTGLK